MLPWFATTFGISKVDVTAPPFNPVTSPAGDLTNKALEMQEVEGANQMAPQIEQTLSSAATESEPGAEAALEAVGESSSLAAAVPVAEGAEIITGVGLATTLSAMGGDE